MKHLMVLMLILSTCTIYAGDAEDRRTANLEFVKNWHADNLNKAEASAELQVLPGILINKTERTVSFYAEATGLGPKEPVEFFLIAQESGNAYESIAVALAAPVDIAAALRIIGLPEGRSTNPAEMQFWPKGERVFMTLNNRRAEELILNSRTGETLPSSGFVFTGSRWVPSTENGEAPPQLAAQIRHPFAIAANYNEPDALLDVPWQAPQTAVYSFQMQSPSSRFELGERLLITMTPEYKDGRKRVQDLLLMLGAAVTPGQDVPLARAEFTLSQATNDILLKKATLDVLLATFSDIVTAGRDPFVQVCIDPDVPLVIAHDTAAVLNKIDSVKGIRVEPPPAGELYYQAFIPNEAFRERKDRYIQPWELHIKSDNDAILTRIDENWTQDDPKPQLSTVDIPITSADALTEVLRTQNTEVRGIYVYAPPTLTYGSLMRLIRPAMKTHPNIYVYLQNP